MKKSENKIQPIGWKTLSVVNNLQKLKSQEKQQLVYSTKSQTIILDLNPPLKTLCL